ncbi:MAG: hypothetical protein JWM04_270, partial [Verrucomicrobiales bacterium]|nr:hypothetical protein [Verrucomicrobiales bacterium]
FVSLFDGKTLNGWNLKDGKTDGYGVTNGMIFCKRGGGGNLLTEAEYGDFILRLDFRLEDGSNNGVGIRTSAVGDAAYMGMEIQMLDDTAAKYTNLRPGQYHGSIYDVVPAKRGALNPVCQWNSEEISAIGRHIKVTVNGKVTVDADLNSVTDAATLLRHPGLLRERGHIGFLGHNDYIEAKNIRIKAMPDYKSWHPLAKKNVPPPGFQALFNGRDLNNWKGLVADPIKRAKMTSEQLASAQAKADASARAHWTVQDGVITFDGKGENLVSGKDYKDFEMIVDWKISEKGDSGIYLRGSPQVQIWERNSPGQTTPPSGSGGLYNNQKNPSKPLAYADRFVGEWNRFRILMIGEKVTVYLNDELVVNATTLENYWERSKPIYPTGAVELQSHSSPLWFRNVFIREINASTNSPAH